MIIQLRRELVEILTRFLRNDFSFEELNAAISEISRDVSSTQNLTVSDLDDEQMLGIMVESLYEVDTTGDEDQLSMPPPGLSHGDRDVVDALSRG